MAAIFFLLILIPCFPGVFIIFPASLMASEVLPVEERGMEEAQTKERREVALALLCSPRQVTALSGP